VLPVDLLRSFCDDPDTRRDSAYLGSRMLVLEPDKNRVNYTAKGKHTEIFEYFFGSA